MISVTANELKTRGVSAVGAKLQEEDELVISVRGKDKYVIMDIQKYAKLREYELMAAFQEAKSDIAEGRFRQESVADHMARVTNDI